MRILAHEVSLALTRHAGTSILNTISAMVAEIADDTHPALALVRLNVGGSPLVARVTKRSASRAGTRGRKDPVRSDQERGDSGVMSRAWG